MTTITDPNPKPARRRPMWLILAALIGTVAGTLLVAWLLISPTLRMPYGEIDPLEFESARWKAAPNNEFSHHSVRLRMADSFLAQQQPIGKTRQQIVELLGEPNDTSYFRDYDMVYYLGQERGPMPIDSEWLVLKLSDGVVSEAELARD